LFNLYGAFFLDGGNIWTLEADTSRVGAQLAWNRKTNENGTIVQDNFLREMALATGFGTRWDFTYFIFRLDFGFPLRNNYPDPARNNTYFIDFSRWKLTDFTLQLGLGYPF
jgi:outer membrane protein assembly factor BamA